LGPFPDLVYESSTVAVQPGDLLCLYTDGVTEAESPAGEHFGEDRLAQALRDRAGRPPGEVQAHVLECLKAWRAGREAGDDVTLVLLRIAG
jgi:sigma-B regulation protein RsbU (phosphoserine phosphatase)